MRRFVVELIMLFLAKVSKADVFDMSAGLTNIDFVIVGNAGNVNDSTGYGAVNDVHQIGMDAVTNAPYVELLNAKTARGPQST